MVLCDCSVRMVACEDAMVCYEFVTRSASELSLGLLLVPLTKDSFRLCIANLNDKLMSLF